MSVRFVFIALGYSTYLALCLDKERYLLVEIEDDQSHNMLTWEALTTAWNLYLTLLILSSVRPGMPIFLMPHSHTDSALNNIVPSV